MTLEIRTEFLAVDNLADPAIHEQYRYPAFENRVISADFYEVNVVPSVFMKWIVDHWRSKKEPHLVARHTDIHLVEIVLLDYISLAQVCLVDAASGR